MNRIVSVLLILFVSISIQAQTPAFPGAEGHGRYVTGGRGGNVYYVTSLNDNINEQGTLRWALNQTSPKTILFKVSGTIYLNSQLRINKGGVTIAGQSAPGDGICIANHPVSINANNIIIRFIRFRMGDEHATNPDGADALGGRDYSDVIIDHCSVSWSTDECASLYGMTNFSMQWCIIAESLRLSGHSKGPHGYGGIWGGRNASFHHNLMAHHDSRTPRFGPAVSTQNDETVDFRNNVIYNWGGEGAYGGEAMNINIVNNFYKPGAATPTGAKRGRLVAFDKKINLSPGDGFYPINNKWGAIYAAGNLVDASTSTGSNITHCNNATNDNWTFGIYNQVPSKYNITNAEKIAIRKHEPFDAGIVTTHTAAVAYQKVLDFAGASLVRDSHDTRIVQETRTGTYTFLGLSEYNGLGSVTYPNGETINWKSIGYPKGGIIDSHYDIKPAGASEDWTPFPILNSTAAPLDTDGDGIPDAWEIANGLNPANPADGKLKTIDSNYTNLEVYLNSIVEDITNSKLADAIDGPTSINYLSLDTIDIYPNPTKGFFTIHNKNRASIVEILNQSGITCKTILVNDSPATINISEFAKGIYFVKSSDVNGSVSTKKIVKY